MTSADTKYSELARFWKKVQVTRVDDVDRCWPWMGALHGLGYGLFRRASGPVVRAHRFSWEAEHGPIPASMAICHKCDNPQCVRPSHLFLGTIAENNADRERKGRGAQPKGERHGNAKLSAAAAVAVRAALERKTATRRQLAEQYGVSKTAIAAVATGKLWRHTGGGRP